MNLMRSERERRVNLLWARCHGTVADYRQRTAPRRKEHDRLQRLDSDTGDERLADLYEELHDLQLQLQEVRQYQSDRLGVLRKERDNYGTLYTTLMNDKEAGTLTDKKQAMHLAVCCAATTKRLQQLQKKAELILELTTLCRKYELQEEKVVPFQKSSVEVPDATGQEMQRAMIMEQLQGTSDTLTLMDHFWQKVAKVQMRHTELQLVHNQLQEENRELRQALCNYLQELAPHKEFQNQETDTLLTTAQQHLAAKAASAAQPQPTNQPTQQVPLTIIPSLGQFKETEEEWIEYLTQFQEHCHVHHVQERKEPHVKL
ncbi:dynein regulatory complex subunit 2-like [Schistocerca piceifrons]|uniref:dynein regulatory complex subunit 2-like n=1 Tax=Schistocerca piceifrons TaxID=274613 RepID=UPI001F5F9C32|nr:dynein regulatory complex subunit 2-like [Schistocerca piceifrons]